MMKQDNAHGHSSTTPSGREFLQVPAGGAVCPARPSSWQMVRMVAGTFILASLALGAPASPLYHSQWWLAVTVFVGLNILQSGLTRWCLMETLMHRLGFRRGD